ncbi:site-specific DNA-methyltransferase [Escherichia coli]|nr:site-specific DNA-methyltransferase [Escherichia coli]EHY4346603.1 site-specific DNA-methyltransferase [Salmonella enterica]EET5814434.1 site-specific DNA-methyltransferase [Escherichia coli]EET5824478.1 site-specific DNA-methyltransferase [Escherichia coli]EET6341969.1 site-specific DNA-methyltransferase [Escherichia coli]
MKKNLDFGFETHALPNGHEKKLTCVNDSFSEALTSYKYTKVRTPLLMCGDALNVLAKLPSDSIDFVMTSPPYWGKREYESGGIGLETNYMDFVKNLANICLQIKRILKPTGSFWLNLGDTYKDKALLGLPWRVAFELTDNQGWILRNSVIWNKLKGGMDNSSDRLGNVHENIFHLVKKNKGYYYNSDAIRTKPRDAKIVNGAVVSATGVSGVRYKRQIELSTTLTPKEKVNALSALNDMLDDISSGKFSDFRMVIRGQQRTTHSESERVSGRAKELKDKGFYFLRYHPKGSKPTDVWDILPEDTQKRKSHFAAYPLDLCRIPILATCPENGIVLDPFSGTGSTLVAAYELGRKSVGIDISQNYLELTIDRFKLLK